MKIFLYLVRGFPGLEDMLDRDLLFEAKTITVAEKKIEMIVDLETISTEKLFPTKNYAIETDNGKTSDFKYYYLSSFELDEPGKEDIRLTLHVNPIQTSI